MKTPIPAAGEAVPANKTSLGRRTFLKGAAIIASAAPSVATAHGDGGTIASLIIRHADARKVSDAAGEISSALWDTADRVPSPYVLAREFRPQHYPIGHDEFGSASQIDKVIDRYRESRHRHYEWMSVAPDGETPVPMSSENAARLARQLHDAEDERTKLTALFSERYTAHQAWRVKSGYEAAAEEAERLYDAMYELHWQIMDFECETLDDVRAKASWLVAEYGDELSSEASLKIMQQFAAAGSAVA